MRRPPQACFGHTASNTAVAGQPDGDLAEQRGDRVLTIILDPAGRATAAARRTARGVQPRLRSHELLLDASQELLTLGQGQAQGGQIREVVRSGDPHNLRAAFAARGPDAYQLHDPGHAVSAHRSTSRKVPSWTRTPNLAAVPLPEGLSQDWGSCRDGCWRMRIVGGLEALPETGAERAVVEGAADLEQQIGPAPGPAHLLRLGHAPVDQEIGCALGQ